MIVYLENECKFHLMVYEQDVIFMEYEDALRAPKITNIRWMRKNINNDNHFSKIINFLASDAQGDAAKGITLLEDTLKIKIHGRVVGHYEGPSI